MDGMKSVHLLVSKLSRQKKKSLASSVNAIKSLKSRLLQLILINYTIKHLTSLCVVFLLLYLKITTNLTA